MKRSFEIVELFRKRLFTATVTFINPTAMATGLKSSVGIPLAMNFSVTEGRGGGARMEVWSIPKP